MSSLSPMISTAFLVVKTRLCELHGLPAGRQAVFFKVEDSIPKLLLLSL
jgi:hypothetical protein